MPTAKPSVGDQIYIDAVPGGGVWQRKQDGAMHDITNDVLTDTSAPDHFTVRGKYPENIYSAQPPWEVVIHDDPKESNPKMRYGTVTAWAF